VTLNRSN